MSESENTGVPVVSKNIPPTVAVIGCGGGGINMVRRALADIGGRVTYRYLDTSEGANLRMGEKAYIIGSGSGSGAVRSENVTTSEKAISRLSDDELGLSDINIVVFTAAGGSGSVIGPLLIKDIAGRRNETRRNEQRLVIAITVASSQDAIHTQNTLDTLKSLGTITNDNNIYLPIMIFDNNNSSAAVNKALPYKLARLVELLTAPTTEADRNDRMNWVNAPKALRRPLKGLRLLHVTVTNSDTVVPRNVEVWPEPSNHIYDSVLAIHTEEHEVEDRPDAHVVFEGTFATIKLLPMIGVIGNAPGAFDALYQSINDKLHRYRVNTADNESPFSGESSSHKTGLHGV